MIRVACLILLVLAAPFADAHKPSDSYLTIWTTHDSLVQGQWDVALRDLDFGVGIDSNDDGSIDWGELRAGFPTWSEYVLAHLGISRGNSPCPVRAEELLVDEHTDGRYAVLRFNAHCELDSGAVRVAYRLFFEIDPQHRGLLRFEQDGASKTAVLSPQRPEIVFGAGEEVTIERTLRDYAQEGVWHIWIGYDHILFLLSLLLPSVLMRDRGHWMAEPSFRASLLDVAKVVTAFTLAHSITLSLAALGIVDLPSRWVESAIALSVVLAAFNNLYPRWYRRRAAVAFGFGLIHGLGFASVLRDLDLPNGVLTTALLGFNIGVEIGQLAIVAAFLPIARGLSQSRFYVPLALNAGSAGIAAIAAFWLAERGLGLNF